MRNVAILYGIFQLQATVDAFSSIRQRRCGGPGESSTTRRISGSGGGMALRVLEDEYGYAQDTGLVAGDIAPIMPMEEQGGGLAFRSSAYNDMAMQRRDAFLPEEATATSIAPIEREGERFYDRPRGILPNGPRSSIAPYGSNSDFYRRRDSDNVLQGNSRNSYSTPGGSHLVELGSSNGRPIDATVETWVGPDNTPQKIRVYSQDGSRYRIRTVSSSYDINTVSVKNEGNLAYPLQTEVTPVPPELQEMKYRRITSPRSGRPQGIQVQGEGSVKTFPIPVDVSAVMVTLQTDGLPLNAKMEILEGPNNVKLSAEVYNDGMHGPAQLILDAPGFMSSTLRIRNTGPMSYPFHVLVEPYSFFGPHDDRRYGGSDLNRMSRFDANGRYRGSPYEEVGGGLDYARAYPRGVRRLYGGDAVPPSYRRYGGRVMEPGW
jgi:hypothetical protein